MEHLGSLRPAELHALLAAGECAVQVGPFRARVRSDIPALSQHLLRHYANCPLVPPDEMADFHLTLSASGGLRRWVRRQVRFRYQSNEPFAPLPLDQAKHTFEWGFNWAVGAQATRFLYFHAATVERNGHAILLPAYSGSGKSTLCAALVHSGWRLLSDEFAIVSLDGSGLHGLGRPVSLKNQSIDVVRRHFPAADIVDIVSGTRKGTVGMLAVPEGAACVGEKVAPRWILAPRFEHDAEPAINSIDKAKMAFFLAGQAFNYLLLGETSFDGLCRLVERCDCLALSYASLGQALELVEEVTDASSAAASSTAVPAAPTLSRAQATRAVP